MGADEAVRMHLERLLSWGDAHMTLDQAVAEFPTEYMNAFPPNVPNTPWHLLEHIRRAQLDILEFIRDPSYVSPPWPEGYWPAREERADEAAWKRTIDLIHKDQRALKSLATDPKTDLYSPIAHGDGQTILRELLLVADHNAYHIGEFAILRQVMGSWPRDRRE